MRVSLRTKILLAIVATMLVGDGVATWVVHDKLLAGAHREATSQAYAQAAQVRALYDERVATLAAEGEAISLYPAVIAAIAQGNVQPLLQWSAQVAALQGTSVTVTDATGRVIARGHAPDRAGDVLTPKLEGLRLALAGQEVTGTEDGDELGLAVRSYVPVRLNGVVVGAVMLTDPLNDRLLGRLAGGDASGIQVRLEPGAISQDARCDSPLGATATCKFGITSAAGRPVATLAVTTPLANIAKANTDAQRGLWLAGMIVLAAGVCAAWLLARSLSRPLTRLTSAVRQITDGDYDRAVEIRTADEIGVLARAFDAMRQQIARTTQALRHERDVRDAVLESAGDGILMVDEMGSTVVVNSRWSALLGGDGLGAAAHLERYGGDGETFADAASRWSAESGRVAVGDFERSTPYRRFRCYSAPVRNRTDTIIGRIFVLRDVTEESAAERMRAALVATVSHELRSPLTAIVGYTDTLLLGDQWEADTQRELLEIVAHAAGTLSRLVDNLLDAAQMDAGILRLEREPVRIERIAQRLIAHRRALVPNHLLVVEADPALPLANADPLRAEQVLTNLLDNAIKYSPAGGTVIIRIAASDDRQIAVSVSDHGVGIPPQHVARLFERFYRVESGQGTKGVGLGLYICKSIVEAHGGHMSVTSAPGEGSTFAFTLPQFVDLDEVAAHHRAETEEKARLPALLPDGGV